MNIRCTPETFGDGPLSKSEIDAVAPQNVRDWFSSLNINTITVQELLPLALSHSEEIYAWLQYAIFFEDGALYFKS